MKPMIPTAGSLDRGELACLAYRLGCARASGVVTVHAPGRLPEVLVLCRGQLLGAPTDALGRHSSRRLAHLASLDHARYTFDASAAVPAASADERPLPLAAWARSHFEAQLDTRSAQELVAELTGVQLTVVAERAPDPALCDTTDLRVLEALASPRRLDQVWHHARTPRFRLLSFLHFLRCVGALALVPRQQPARAPRAEDAHALLGVTPDADRVALKRAYRRLARALHPDLHPGASEADRRNLERRLADVTRAYARLTSSSAA